MLAHRVVVPLWLMLITGAVQAAPNETKVTELAPGVFFRKAQTEPTFTGCNQGWVVFRDYVLVIDANFPGQADEVIPVIRTYTDKPIRFVFDTHYHGDHADGNMQYARIGATVLAHERSQPLFQTKGIDGFTKAQADPKRQAEYGPLAYAIPSLYFSHKLIFDDGEQRVELMFLGHAHTAGDAVAWLPKHRILFTGDACVNGAFNYTGDSNTESWISVLGAMQELDVKQIAPGHGELAGPELLALQKRYFAELRSSLRKAIDAGKTLDQIKAEHDLPFYREWTGVAAKTRVENIEHVYRELTAANRPLSQHRKFQAWRDVAGAGKYDRAAIWNELGTSPLDQHWSQLADLYLSANTSVRKQIRDYFTGRDQELLEMTMYVRRMAASVHSAADVRTIRRGLAVAAMEGGRADFDAATTALALLRSGGERAGIAMAPLFREIQREEFIAPENKPYFEYARTRSPAELADLVRSAGPPSWEHR